MSLFRYTQTDALRKGESAEGRSQREGERAQHDIFEIFTASEAVHLPKIRKLPDPLTFTAVSFLLTCVALPTCYIPARRATKVDPTVALKHE